MDQLDAKALVGLVLQVCTPHLLLFARTTMPMILGESDGAHQDGFLIPRPCQRAVACLIQVAKARSFNLEKPLRLHDEATMVQNKQTKRHKPLVPEFHHFVKQPAGSAIQPGTKLMAPHLGGSLREEPQGAEELDKDHDQDVRKFLKVGVYHTPKQFLSMAKQVAHPMDVTEHPGLR